MAGPTAWAAVTSNPGPSTTYTGCLGTSSGGIYNVAKGNVPLAACSGTDKQIKLAGGTITSVVAGAGLTGGATKGNATLAVDPTWLAANATTGVTAGTGLTGGAANGPATLGIDPSYLSNNTTTGVSAGTGLTGGAPNGPASLAVDPAYRLPQGCSTGTMAVTNGSAWGCSTAQSKQFSFPSVTSGHIVGATLGSLQLQLTCGTSTANVTVYADSAVGGSFNMAYANLSDSSSHDTGFNVSGTPHHQPRSTTAGNRQLRLGRHATATSSQATSPGTTRAAGATVSSTATLSRAPADPPAGRLGTWGERAPPTNPPHPPWAVQGSNLPAKA